MKLRFFRIPVFDSGGFADELNAFLASHSVASIERHFVAEGGNSFWALMVSVTEREPSRSGGGDGKRNRIDYRETLNAQDFAVYSELRDVRKRLADKEGVPAYVVFGNEQLAAMVTGRVVTAAGIEAIPGVGAAKVERYAAPILEVLRKHFRKAGADATPSPGP